MAVAASTAAAQFGGLRPAGPVRRAAPPADWPAPIAEQFFPDAFATLEGPRPDFTAKQTAPGATTTAPAATAPAGGITWSALVSPETLVDEIKQMKRLVDQSVAKQRGFISGGFKDARNGFSSIAAAFGVIAVYDGDVRWKKDAPRARDLFARVAFDCNQGNPATFTVAEKAAETLASLLDGNAIEAGAAAGLPWNRIAARPPLMWRLDAVEKSLGEAIASRAAFDKGAERLVHDAEIAALIGEFIRQPDFEFHDDETYAGYASTMRDAAVTAAAAARKGDFDAASAAVSSLRKACTDCHGDYR